MRRLLDLVIGLMLVTGLCGWGIYRHGRQHRHQELEQVRQALAQLHDRVYYHRALKDVALASSGFPAEVSPQWFDDGQRPRNVLIDPGHPWLDQADPGDKSEHPPDPVVDSADQAGFWYSPHHGIFRIRVPQQISADRALHMYNQLNDATLAKLPVAPKTASAAEDGAPAPSSQPVSPPRPSPASAALPSAERAPAEPPSVEPPSAEPPARRRPTLLGRRASAGGRRQNDADDVASSRSR